MFSALGLGEGKRMGEESHNSHSVLTGGAPFHLASQCLPNSFEGRR